MSGFGGEGFGTGVFGGIAIGISGFGIPAGPSTYGIVLPSYLYQQYSDDDALQAFVDGYNAYAQAYVTWFQTIQLPVYTGLSGNLLDWVANGLYGYSRPVLPAGFSYILGPYNTFAFNELPYNEYEIVEPTNFYATTDDIYQRCLTWHFFKGDGKYFSVPWLKRRIMRWFEGINGTAPNIDQTYQISVTFGTGNEVTITLVESVTTDTGGGSLFNGSVYNSFTFNSGTFVTETFPALPNAAVFQAAVASGALELPFQFTWNVVIETVL